MEYIKKGMGITSEITSEVSQFDVLSFTFRQISLEQQNHDKLSS